MPAKRYLFTPGPTPVPPQVLAALAEPVLHHRGADFRPVFERCLAPAARGLPHGVRRAALHRVGDRRRWSRPCANLCAEGTRAVVVSAGYFGERWEQIAALHGADGRARCATSGARRPRARRRRRAAARARRRGRRLPDPVRDVDRRRRRHRRRSRPRRRRPARSSRSTRSRASARCRSRWTPGGSTPSSPARRRR